MKRCSLNSAIVLLCLLPRAAASAASFSTVRHVIKVNLHHLPARRDGEQTKPIERHALLPFGIAGALLLAAASGAATVYVPHLFSSYATRYGVIGAVFAMISVLFIAMVIVVGSAAAGREIEDELGRIRRGEKPADDEVRHQWDQVTAEARSRWDTLREQSQERRRKRAQEKEKRDAQ